MTCMALYIKKNVCVTKQSDINVQISVNLLWNEGGEGKLFTILLDSHQTQMDIRKQNICISNRYSKVLVLLTLMLHTVVEYSVVLQ